MIVLLGIVICIILIILVMVFVLNKTVLLKNTTKQIMEPFSASQTFDIYGGIGNVIGRINYDGEYIGSSLDVVPMARLHQNQMDVLCSALINEKTIPVTNSNSCAHTLVASGTLHNLRSDDPLLRPTYDKSYCFINL